MSQIVKHSPQMSRGLLASAPDAPDAPFLHSCRARNEGFVAGALIHVRYGMYSYVSAERRKTLPKAKVYAAGSRRLFRL